MDRFDIIDDKAIDLCWARSYVGMQMSVPDWWWEGCKGKKNIVELLKMAHTAQFTQQAGVAVNIQYLTDDAGKANKQLKSLNTKVTKQSRLEWIAQ